MISWAHWQHYTTKSTTKHSTQKELKTALLTQSIDNVTENTELNM